MLREWVLHNDYQERLQLKMLDHLFMQGSRVIALNKYIAKPYLLNLNPLFPVVKTLYPDLGQPAINQQGVIRSLVLMLDQQEYSITNWALKVASDTLLFDLCGFERDYGPAIASYSASVNISSQKYSKYKGVHQTGSSPLLDCRL